LPAARRRRARELGRVDVLVNNAFLSAPYELFENAKLDDWRKIFDVNLFGSLALSQAVVPYMKEQGGGSIIMVNTMSLRIIEPRFGGYAASKAALMTAAQTMAKELVPTRSASTRSCRDTSGPCARALLRVAREATRHHAEGSLRRDRRADGARPHSDVGGDRRHGRLLRFRPVVRGDRSGARRELRASFSLVNATIGT